MMPFTALGRLRHWDETEGLIAMEDGETLPLPNELVELFCSRGWGTAPGFKTQPAEVSVHKLTVEA